MQVVLKGRKTTPNNSLAKNPLFSATYIYFINFFITLVKEKSGKVATKPAKPLRHKGFTLAIFVSKVAKNPLFPAKNVRTTLQLRPNFSSFPEKVTKAHFRVRKVARDLPDFSA